MREQPTSHSSLMSPSVYSGKDGRFPFFKTILIALQREDSLKHDRVKCSSYWSAI